MTSMRKINNFTSEKGREVGKIENNVQGIPKCVYNQHPSDCIGAHC